MEEALNLSSDRILNDDDDDKCVCITFYRKRSKEFSCLFINTAAMLFLSWQHRARFPVVFGEVAL